MALRVVAELRYFHQIVNEAVVSGRQTCNQARGHEFQFSSSCNIESTVNFGDKVITIPNILCEREQGTIAAAVLFESRLQKVTT